AGLGAGGDAEPQRPLRAHDAGAAGAGGVAAAAPEAGRAVRRLGRPAPGQGPPARAGGDVRVTADTIVVTYYNAPNTEALKGHYEGLPDKLQAQGVKPEIPWLYGYKLDFRFR